MYLPPLLENGQLMPDFQKYLKRKWANWAFTQTCRFKLQQPMVSFTFDDVPGSAFSEGARILEAYGGLGTFYLALSMLQQAPSESGFTQQQMETARQRGHELGCHTYGHIDFSRTGIADSQRDLETNRQRLLALCPGLKLRSFSYPFGAQTLGVKKSLVSRFSSARGILPGIHYREADLYNLKTVKLYEGQLPLSQQLEHIEQAVAGNGWLIFYTHDVRASYSPHGCSPAYFEKVVKACTEAGLDILPVSEAVERLGASQI